LGNGTVRKYRPFQGPNIGFRKKSGILGEKLKKSIFRAPVNFPHRKEI
jgi:hypothetical protein